jgi:hypothetical protein
VAGLVPAMTTPALASLPNENAILIGRTEKHIDAPYLVAGEYEKLGVAKTLAAFAVHL